MAQGKKTQWEESKSNQIKMLASLDVPLSHIADITKLDRRTIQLVYKAELETQEDFVHSHVKAKIIQLALKGDKDMLKHFSKCQMGWSEKSEVEHKGISTPVINIITNKKDGSDK